MKRVVRGSFQYPAVAIESSFNPEPTATAVRFPVTSKLFGDESNHSKLEGAIATGYARMVRYLQFP